MNIPKQLIDKYNQPIPRYTSYPPANYFKEVTDDAGTLEGIRLSNLKEPSNISIYLHIPFCAKLCSYCGCNTHITHDKDLIGRYVEALKKEIVIVSGLLDKSRKVSQVHWGGGTPNYLPAEKVEEIMSLLYERFSFSGHPEIAMECHPAHLTFDYVDRLIRLGFNRLSLGIQDFDEKVLKTVNRDAPVIPVRDLVRYIKSRGTVSVNLDFIYGLPYQTTSSFLQTIREAADISPDRLVTFSYAHVPWIKKAQKVLEQYPLPDKYQKAEMFFLANDYLRKNGFVFIGLDHYAKPEDELSMALQNKTLHRNFQGYCTRRSTGQVYAFGVSAISQLTGAFLQNTKVLPEYFSAIDAGRLPVVKAYYPNDQEWVLGRLIDELMCNLRLDWELLGEAVEKDIRRLKEMIGFDEEKLKPLENDGLIEVDEKKVVVTENGRFFIRNIAAAFDPLLARQGKRFSQSI